MPSATRRTGEAGCIVPKGIAEFPTFSNGVIPMQISFLTLAQSPPSRSPSAVRAQPRTPGMLTVSYSNAAVFSTNMQVT